MMLIFVTLGVLLFYADLRSAVSDHFGLVIAPTIYVRLVSPVEAVAFGPWQALLPSVCERNGRHFGPISGSSARAQGEPRAFSSRYRLNRLGVLNGPDLL